VECMGDVYGLHWLDRRKAIDIVENRWILHPEAKIHVNHWTKKQPDGTNTRSQITDLESNK
jgi:hypothetical protein